MRPDGARGLGTPAAGLPGSGERAIVTSPSGGWEECFCIRRNGDGEGGQQRENEEGESGSWRRQKGTCLGHLSRLSVVPCEL